MSRCSGKQADERNRQVTFKNCAPYTDYVSEISNTEVDKSKGLNVLVPMCNLIEYSNNFAKTGSLWQYRKDDNIRVSELSKFKAIVYVSLML